MSNSLKIETDGAVLKHSQNALAEVSPTKQKSQPLNISASKQTAIELSAVKPDSPLSNDQEATTQGTLTNRKSKEGASSAKKQTQCICSVNNTGGPRPTGAELGTDPMSQNEIDMICCDVCNQWFHHGCMGLTTVSITLLNFEGREVRKNDLALKNCQDALIIFYHADFNAKTIYDFKIHDLTSFEFLITGAIPRVREQRGEAVLLQQMSIRAARGEANHLE